MTKVKLDCTTIFVAIMFLTVTERTAKGGFSYAYVNPPVASLEDKHYTDYTGKDVGDSCSLADESTQCFIEALLKADLYGLSATSVSLSLTNRTKPLELFVVTLKVEANNQGRLVNLLLPCKLKANRPYLLSLGFDVEGAWGKISMYSLARQVNTKLLLALLFFTLTFSQVASEYVRGFLQLPKFTIEKVSDKD